MLAERFDAASYLIDHTDVAAAGVDPWQHYCEFGWREKRKIRLLDGQTNFGCISRNPTKFIGERWQSQRSNLRRKIKTAMKFIWGHP